MNNKKDTPLRDRIAKAITGESMPNIDADVIRELAKLLEETDCPSWRSSKAACGFASRAGRR
jgi:hypothetical protein